MNDDLISRSALSEALEWEDADVCEYYGDGYSEWGFTRSSIRELLQKIPAVDAVIPVRCKDCLHTGIAGRPPFMFRYCRHPKGLTAGMRETDFCPYGERRADE